MAEIGRLGNVAAGVAAAARAAAVERGECMEMDCLHEGSDMVCVTDLDCLEWYKMSQGRRLVKYVGCAVGSTWERG